MSLIKEVFFLKDFSLHSDSNIIRIERISDYLQNFSKIYFRKKEI